MSADQSVAILFRFYSDIMEEETVETVLAGIADKDKGYFRIERIPFYVTKVAVDDIIWAEYNEKEDALTYRKTIHYSGNSTIQCVLMNDEYDVDAIMQVFDDTGCGSEKMNQRYFSLNIPADADYLPVKQRLDELEEEKIIDYAEAALSEKHQYKSYLFR